MLAKDNFALRAYFLVIVAATVAAIPMAIHGNPWGHDINLHLRSWMDAVQQFREGTVFPRWAAGANQGYGEPFFIFYPPLSRAIGTLLGLILPWKIVPGVYIWLMLVVAGGTMWKCASEWLAPADAMMASFVYATNPYILIIAYKRSNYADLLASALFPLLVWGGIQVGRESYKEILQLSAAFAAIWISDLPAGVIASYSLAGLLVFNGIFRRSFRPALLGAAAILAGFGSIAFFLFPAAWEQRWVSVGEAVRFEWAPENNFLFNHSNLPPYVTFNRGLSIVAVLMIIIAAIAAVLARRLRQDDPIVWRSLVALGAVSAFMMFPPSLVLYQTLPKLRFVEFPWRWLSPLSVVAVLLVVSAVSQVGRKWIAWASVALMVAGFGAVVVRTVNWDTSHYLEGLIADQRSGMGYPIRVGDFSSPRGSQLAKLDKAAPMVAVATAKDDNGPIWEGPQIRVDQWLGERKAFSVVSPRPLLLKLKLFMYPGWQAKLNGAIVPLQTDPATGQMLVQVPVGLSRVEIQFERTWDRTLGIAVSLATILTLALFALWLRKRGASFEDRKPG